MSLCILYPNRAEFERMIANRETFLLDFFATWCGPCKMLSYVLDEAAEKYEGKIHIVKIDIDREPELAERYDITIVPTLLFIKNGEIAQKETGFAPLERLSPMLDALLGEKRAERPKNGATHYELIIIGGGAAGLTAAIYARRAALHTLILESFAPGGKLIKTYEIQNWPGIKSADGSQLAYSIYEQAMALGPDYLYEKVAALEDGGELKTVLCESGKRFTAKAVIIASGTVERMMGIPGEADMIGRGISFCAVCDSSFYKNKDIVVVGGGNSALEESLYLTQFVKSITIVNRGDSFRAEDIVRKNALGHEKIKAIMNHMPKEVLIKDDRVAGLLIENRLTGEMRRLGAAGIFPYIGNDPITKFADRLGITDEQGYLTVNDFMETRRKGIYGAGDVCAKPLKQLVTATNDGAIAAQSAFHYIKGK